MKKFGDRRDGKRVRNLDSMHGLVAHLKPLRCDSDVYINRKMDVTELVKWFEKKKKDEPDLTYFHAFMTLIAKIFYSKPLLNRFIVNRKFYDRNEVSIAFTAKADFSEKSKDILTVTVIDDNDTYKEIKEKTLNAVKKVRSNSDSGANGAMNSLNKLPVGLLKIVFGFVKFLDKHDLLPLSLTKDNLYYSSVIVSNIGSIHSGAIYHNLSDFGTSSILITIGEIKKEKVLMPDGKEEIRDLCEFGITLDERIADGVYYVKSMLLMQDMLNKPECLEEKVSEKVNETTKYKY